MRPKSTMQLHFLGIGGDGMSGLAKVYSELGWRVTGCNIEENRRTRQLRELGIPVAIGHDVAHLQRATHLIVSSAIPPDNIELQEAQRLGLTILHRLDLLRELTTRRYTIGVAGTHGKTTTAAMITTLLERAWLDPTFVIGAASPTLGTHARLGLGRHLVAEICESDGRFVNIHPHIAVITNIGRDHLNFYRSEEALLESFTRFASHSELCIACADDPGVQRAIIQRIPSALTYSIERPADLVAHDISFSQFRTRFQISWRGRHAASIELLYAPGVHNVYNALAALVVGKAVGLSFADMAAHLRDFQLPERRFQVLINNGITLVDDYAHLPEQIQRNLQAIRQSWHPPRIVAIFQPHRFTRTYYLGREFSAAFDLADIVVLTDIYPAFEPPIPGVDVSLIVEALQRRHHSVLYLPWGEDFADRVRALLRPGDFVIGFGAGNLNAQLHRLARAWEGINHERER
jgi:UDP-N-acetylmuramate--alanine ligase